MKKDRLTPRGNNKKLARSISPQNVQFKAKNKENFSSNRNVNK